MVSWASDSLTQNVRRYVQEVQSKEGAEWAKEQEEEIKKRAQARSIADTFVQTAGRSLQVETKQIVAERETKTNAADSVGGTGKKGHYRDFEALLSRIEEAVQRQRRNATAGLNSRKSPKIPSSAIPKAKSALLTTLSAKKITSKTSGTALITQKPVKIALTTLSAKKFTSQTSGASLITQKPVLEDPKTPSNQLSLHTDQGFLLGGFGGQGRPLDGDVLKKLPAAKAKFLSSNMGRAAIQKKVIYTSDEKLFPGATLAFFKDGRAYQILNRENLQKRSGRYKTFYPAQDFFGAQYAAIFMELVGDTKRVNMREIKNLMKLNGVDGFVETFDVFVCFNRGKITAIAIQVLGNEGDLSHYQKKITNQWERQEITGQLLNVMEKLERRQLIHCDLKGRNILVRTQAWHYEGETKERQEGTKIYVGDLGLLCSAAKPTKGRTTHDYASPEYELAHGASDQERRSTVTHKHDMWGCGVVLYELWSSKLAPWTGMNTNEKSKAISQCAGADSFDWTTAEQNGAPLALIKAMLSFKPEDRLTGSQALASWLQKS